MMGGGGVGSILLLVVLVIVVFALIKAFPDWQERLGLNGRREDSRGEDSRREDSAEEVLRQRFARGEIDAQDYEERQRILREKSPASHR